jgi:hypothetical protein
MLEKMMSKTFDDLMGALREVKDHIEGRNQLYFQKLIDEGLKSGTSSRSMEDLLREARALAEK